VFTVAIEAGDTFAYAKGTYKLRQLIEHVNAALRKIGQIKTVDTTTLDTVANQTEYTCPVAWKYGITEVDIQDNPNDSNDNNWIPNHDWKYIPAAAGTAGLLIFKKQPTASRDVRVRYLAPHPRVSAYNDVIHESVDEDLLVAAVVEAALTWRYNRTRDPDDRILLNSARQELAEAKATLPVTNNRRRPKIFTIPRS
jgi:hypothetical protein